MAILNDALLFSLVFETFGLRRFTEDSPIQPDVWVRFLKLADQEKLDTPVSLILTPKETPSKDGRPAGGAAALAECIRTRILGTPRLQERRKRRTKQKVRPDKGLKRFRLAATARNVAIEITFEDMLRYLVPITCWWTEVVNRDYKDPHKLAEHLADAADKSITVDKALAKLKDTEFFRFVALTSVISLLADKNVTPAKAKELIEHLTPPTRRRGALSDEDEDDLPLSERRVTAKLNDLAELWHHYTTLAERTFGRPDSIATPGATDKAAAARSEILIWSINRNRTAHRGALAATPPVPSLGSKMRLSSQTVKADAAIQLFSINTSDLTWAIVDTGIDHTHPAFARTVQAANGPKTRIVKTLDFTKLRDLLAEDFDVPALVEKIPWGDDGKSEEEHILSLHTTIDSIRRRNVNGRDLDWSLLELLILQDQEKTLPPMDPHGTHVAGILGGYLPNGVEADPEPFIGVCPDIQLYDLRVFGEDAGGDEFTILAALDYISWVNRDPERPTLHGVNLSLAIRHVVDAHACGRTPICDACNRLVGSGVVVVAAAGNAGFDSRQDKATLGSGYRGTSITDPGNAEHVITVGATHRNDPHTYGVSYFSSRGPTGDGRMKPDLVAPGEKIRSTAPDKAMLIKDGTSMAAPHVSGVCALLMARHREFVGQPKRVKDVLIATATDLGRERSFQGAGLVDALRALQSV